MDGVEFHMKSLSGDIGPVLTGKNKKIIWNMEEDLEDLKEFIYFEVWADLLTPINSGRSNTNYIAFKKRDYKFEPFYIEELNQNKVLEYSEEGLIKFSIKNNTSEELKNLLLKLNYNKDILNIDGDEYVVDNIGPNSRIELSIPVKNINGDNLSGAITDLNFKLLSNEALITEDNFELPISTNSESILKVSLKSPIFKSDNMALAENQTSNNLIKIFIILHQKLIFINV